MAITPKRKPPQPAASHAPGAAAGAAAALAPYMFDEADLMTYQSLRHNVDVSLDAVERFLQSIRPRLPNNGNAWTVRTDQKGLDPPRAKAGGR